MATLALHFASLWRLLALTGVIPLGILYIRKHTLIPEWKMEIPKFGHCGTVRTATLEL